MFSRLTLALNRLRARRRGPRVPPRNLLLLLPHCLQRSACPHNVIMDLDRCERCGRCPIADLIGLRDELGIQCRMVGGGREAVVHARQPDARVIVAVACEKELADGIRGAFPKRVWAIPNERPEGPCRNTRVDIDRVRQVIRDLIIPGA